MIAELVNRLRDVRRNLTAASASIHETLSGLRAQIAAKRAEIRRLEGAPVPPEEVKERAREVVAARGRRWIQEHGNGLLHTAATGGRALAAYGSGPVHLPGGIEKDPFGFLAATDPDLAAEMLGRLTDLVEYEPGPSSAERPRLIQAAREELTQLEQAEEGAVDEACAAGVVVQHRPDVLARRATEADHADRLRQQEAGRLARQAAIDRDAERRAAEGRVSRSPFLAGDKPRW